MCLYMKMIKSKRLQHQVENPDNWEDCVGAGGDGVKGGE